jgi:hypothetical protein
MAEGRFQISDCGANRTIQFAVFIFQFSICDFCFAFCIFHFAFFIFHSAFCLSPRCPEREPLARAARQEPPERL